MRISLITGLCVAIAIASANARDLTVRCLAMNATPMPKLFVKTSKGFKPLEFSSIQPTETIKLTVEGPLQVYNSAEQKSEKATAAYAIPVPGNTGGVLILGWMTKDKANFSALPDDLSDVGPRDWLIINAAPEPVAVQVGAKAKPIAIKPGASVTKRVTLPKEDAAEFRAFREHNGKPKMFYSTFMPFRKEARCVLLFYPDGKHIRIKQMFDMNLIKKKEKP